MKFDSFNDLKVGDIIEYYIIEHYDEEYDPSLSRMCTKELILNKKPCCITRILDCPKGEYVINSESVIDSNQHFKIIGKVDMNVYNVLFGDIE